MRYVLSRAQQGFVLPATGMAGWVAGLTLLRWAHLGWVAYAGPFLTVSSRGPAPGRAWVATAALAPHGWYQRVWFGRAAVLGYIVLCWRNLAQTLPNPNRGHCFRSCLS